MFDSLNSNGGIMGNNKKKERKRLEEVCGVKNIPKKVENKKKCKGGWGIRHLRKFKKKNNHKS